MSRVMFLLLCAFVAVFIATSVEKASPKAPAYRPYDCMKHDQKLNIWLPCRDSKLKDIHV